MWPSWDSSGRQLLRPKICAPSRISQAGTVRRPGGGGGAAPENESGEAKPESSATRALPGTSRQQPFVERQERRVSMELSCKVGCLEAGSSCSVGNAPPALPASAPSLSVPPPLRGACPDATFSRALSPSNWMVRVPRLCGTSWARQVSGFTSTRVGSRSSCTKAPWMCQAPNPRPHMSIPAPSHQSTQQNRTDHRAPPSAQATAGFQTPYGKFSVSRACGLWNTR